MTTDVCKEIIEANSIKTKDVIVVKTNGGAGFQSRSNGQVDENLDDEMETKYTDRFDEPTVLLV